MYRDDQTWPAKLARKEGKKFTSILRLIAFLICILPGITAFGQQPGKIQQAIDAIKAANYCEDQDYHTDGQRTVWVKSYKKWEPEDLAIMKKESPAALKFLGMAAQRSRYDVLRQLLPDYYRIHGGVEVFAADIMREQGIISTNAVN